MKRLYLCLALALFVLPLSSDALSINGRGQVGMGIGNNLVSVEGHVIAQPGGGTSFQTDDLLVFQVCAPTCALESYDLRTKQRAVVSARGANALNAGGGVWAAWLNGFGLFTSDGLHLPTASPAVVGPDGAIAYRPDYQSNGPTVLRETSGAVSTLTAGTAEDVQLLGHGRAIWRERFAVRTAGIPNVRTLDPSSGLWNPRAAFLAGEWWVLYYHDTAGLVLHPFTSTRGYPLLREPHAYSAKLIALTDSVARIAYSWTEGERPEDLRVVDVDVRTAPRMELAAAVTPPTPPPTRPTVPVPPLPPPPPAADVLPADIFEALKLARLAFPTPLGDQGAALINVVAFQFRQKGIDAGLEEKTGGNNCPQPKTAERVACDIFRIGAVGYDVLGDQEGAGRVVRAEGGPATRRLVLPVDPGGIVIDPPKPDACDGLKAKVATLEASIAQFNELHTRDWARIDELEAQARDLTTSRDQAITERDAARAERDALKNEPASCEVRGVPGWAGRLGIKATCVVKK